MKTKDIIQGLQILQQYRHNTDGYDVGAAHDELFAYSTDEPLAINDFKTMVDLGWFQNWIEDDESLEYVEDPEYENYDPEGYWKCFV